MEPQPAWTVTPSPHSQSGQSHPQDPTGTAPTPPFHPHTLLDTTAPHPQVLRCRGEASLCHLSLQPPCPRVPAALGCPRLGTLGVSVPAPPPLSPHNDRTHDVTNTTAPHTRQPHGHEPRRQLGEGPCPRSGAGAWGHRAGLGHRDTSLLLLGQLPLHGDRVCDSKRGSGTPAWEIPISKCLIAARHAGVLLDLCLEIRWLEKPGPLPFLPFLGGQRPLFPPASGSLTPTC